MINIKETRKALGLSLQDLSDIIGVSRQLICCWENGSRKFPIKREQEIKDLLKKYCLDNMRKYQQIIETF